MDTHAQSVLMPPLPGSSWHHPIVASWDEPISWSQWRAQLRVPPTFAPPGTSRVYAVANQKGGVGKTTTTVELGAAAAARGQKTRIIAADPQKAGLSEWIKPVYPEGLDPKKRRGLSDVFFKRCTLEEATYPTKFRNLYVVPSGRKLGSVEKDGDLVGGEITLLRGIQNSPGFDVTLIDCGPTLGLLTVAALAAATDGVIMPTKAGHLETLGVIDILRTIRQVRDAYNPALDIIAVVLTEWARSALMKETALQLAQDFPDAVVAPVRVSVKAKETVKQELPLRLFAPRDNAARDLDQLGGILFGQKVAA